MNQIVIRMKIWVLCPMFLLPLNSACSDGGSSGGGSRGGTALADVKPVTVTGTLAVDDSFVALAPVNGSSKLQRLFMDPSDASSTTSYQSSAQTSLIKDVTAPAMGRAVYINKTGAEKLLFFGGAAGGHGITYQLPRAQFLAAGSSPTDPAWTENLTTHIPPVGCPELAYLANLDRVIAFGGHNSPVTLQGGRSALRFHTPPVMRLGPTMEPTGTFSIP